MEKVYMVYEGTYDDDHYYGTDGYEETLVAIYPEMELVQKHMKLWKEKTQKEIDEVDNPGIAERSLEINETERELGYQLSKPEFWVFDEKRSNEYDTIFTRYNGGYERYCRYEDHDILKEVKVK